MLKIHLLPEELINKIAAGEVIERPASVVKELVENSLDAGATKIVVEIKDSGKQLIRVSDNGEGMEEEDAKNSVLRHATSKISSGEDLFNIQTLGFRGEALASIAAVSQLSLITKTKNKLEGYNLVLEGGQLISSGILAAETGTTIEVANLFFNTPARKKFLKSDQVELRHIIDVMIIYALINPAVSFKLIHEKHELVNSPLTNDLKEKISTLYGTSLAKDLLEVDYQTSDVKIYGFIAKPHQARNDKNQQFIYVNHRGIRNEEISKAVYDAYHSLLFVNKHPVFILNLEINPQKIDVNVHPTKAEIKIEQKETINNAVFTAVKETLQKNNLLPVLDLEFEQQLAFGIPKAEGRSKIVPHWEISTQKILNRKERYDEEAYATPDEEVYPQKTLFPRKIPPLRILGQLQKTFFVAETIDGVLFIDQHVVQERVLYEKFMEQFMNKKVQTQHLLQGEILELSPAEKSTVEEYLSKFLSFGFQLEPFGQNSFVLKTIPALFGRTQPKELFYEVLSQLSQGKNKLEELQEEIITRMACRASIKAGDEVSIPEISNLLKELEQTKLPYTCPHGRSIFIKVEKEELEKKFRRK